jgi:hypothetical protein
MIWLRVVSRYASKLKINEFRYTACSKRKMIEIIFFSLSCHITTFLSTLSACISALFAFFDRWKLFTLDGACITYFCTYIADLLCIFTSSWHQAYSSTTHICAVARHHDASCHSSYFLIAKTWSTTCFTSFTTNTARINACLIFRIL